MSNDRLNFDRRTLLGTLGAGAALAVAGCVGGDDDDDHDDTGEDDDHDDTGAADDHDDTGTADDDHDDEAQQLSEPTEFPEEEACAVCEMVTEEYPDWNAQLVKEDGARVYFCSSGCMLAYYADPEHFGGEGEALENAWVTEYESGELIDGQECYYVRVGDSDHVDDIMMMNPTPFAERDDAEAFIDELNDEFDAGYDHDADIITFDEFDMELAMMYRSRFFEDENGDHEYSNDHDH